MRQDKVIQRRPSSLNPFEILPKGFFSVLLEALEDISHNRTESPLPDDREAHRAYPMTLTKTPRLFMP